MMVRLALLAAALLPFAAPVVAQPAGTTEADVVAAVRANLDAFEANDAAALAALTHPDGVNFSVRYLPGQERVRVRTNRGDLEEAKLPRLPKYKETFWAPSVMVRGDLAQFWAPYSFDIDGKRSHCGIDNFTLVRIDGRWVMTNGSWTVEPPETSCAALGEPK